MHPLDYGKRIVVAMSLANGQTFMNAAGTTAARPVPDSSLMRREVV